MKIGFISSFLEMPGIEHLSAMLKQRGHAPRVFISREFLTFVKGWDRVQRLLQNRTAILRRLKEDRYDVVGFSVLSDDFPWACEFAKLVKEHCNAHVVFGNIHPTSVPEEVIKVPYVDSIVLGEADFAFPELCDALEAGTGAFDIPNVWIKRNGAVVRNPVRRLVSDLDALPFPDKEIYYSELPYYRNDYIVSTGRGCQYNCTYCCASVYRSLYRGLGKYYRRRSVANVIQELEEGRQRYGYGYVQFYDENLLYDLEWVKAFMDLYRERIHVPFKCCGTVHHLSQEMVDTLARGGCKMISIGIQSTSEEVRRRLNRTETNAQIEEAVRRLKKAGILVYVDHIFGFPFEPVSNQEEALRFYNTIRPHVISSYFLKYYPMTQIAREYGDRLQRSHRENTSYFSTGDVDDPETYHKYHSMMSLMTFLPARVVRILIETRSYRYLPKLGNLSLLGRLVGSSWKNEIQARRMFHTWKDVVFKRRLSYR